MLNMPTTPKRHRIILVGGGPAHLGVLADFIAHGRPDADVVMISDRPQTLYSGLLPAWVAGVIPASDMVIDSAALARRAGVRFICDAVTGLAPIKREMGLAGGDVLPFSIASLAIGGQNDARPFAALGDRLLPIRPIETFMDRWTNVIQSAQTSRILRLIVVGGGAGGVELALAAAAAALRSGFNHDIGLIAGHGGILPGHAIGVRRRAMALLKAKGVAVHDGNATGHVQGVQLSDGRILPTDWVITATGSRAPQWLSACGLATDANGFVSIGADLRSISHPHIFAAGDIVQRADRPLPRSGVHAVKAGPILAANIRGAVRGAALKRYEPRSKTLYLLASGDGRALLSYGRWAALGRPIWWLKRFIDTRFIRRYARLTIKRVR